MSNLFGTDGVRSKVGNNVFVSENLPKLGNAIAKWAISKYINPKILIVHDTRISCSFVKSALKSGLLLNPVSIFDAQVLPTPAVALIKNYFNIAIIISASHNPWQDNGIKIVDLAYGKLNLKDELEISGIYLNLSPITPTPLVPSVFRSEAKKNVSRDSQSYDNLGQEEFYPEAENLYLENVLEKFKFLSLKNIKIALDCANGATYKVAAKIFEKLSADLIIINNKPNGKNINLNCGALEPENLSKTIIENNCDFGFAFDGDGDRVVVVNRFGEIKDGDDILAILINNPDYQNINKLVGTVMTNRGLELFLKKQGIELVRTSVGDKYISEQLAKENLLLGGEQSGHIILKNLSPMGDGILAALKVLETVILTKNHNLETFKKYPQVLLNIPVKIKLALDAPPISQLIDLSKSQITDGRLLVRYSGTENCLRIMVEEETQERAEFISHALADKIQKELC